MVFNLLDLLEIEKTAMEGFEPNEFIPTDQITGIIPYLKSIDWSERWLQGLIVMHLSLLLICIITRKMMKFQIGLFLVLLAVIFFAERINEVAAKNWKLFSKQQYFDSTGMFISLLLSLPFLIISLIIMVQWLYRSSLLLIDLKRKQLMHKHKMEQKKKE